MQDRMASKSRLLNSVYRGLLSFLIPLWSLVSRTLPLGLLYAMGWFFVELFLLIRPKYQRALRANFAQILGERADSARVREVARRMTHNHGRYWIDFFYWSERGPKAAGRTITGVERLEAMTRCLDAGKGCILLTAHLGNWEMGGLLLGDRARQVAVIYVPDRFGQIEHYRSRYRRRTGLTEIPIATDPFTALPALRVLRDGGMVAVQGDRDFNASGITVPFFGREAQFPRGPAVLSLVSGAPILPVFILRGVDTAGAGSGGFRIVFFDPIEPQGNARDEGAVAAMVAKTAAIIETMVRAHPEQWYCFYPFWGDSVRPGSLTRSQPGDGAECVAPTAAT